MRRVLGCLVAASLTVVGGCSDEPGDDSPTTVPAQLDCASLIGDDAFAALGWRASGDAVEKAGRCERRAARSGAVTVSTRAVTVAGDEAQRRVLDDECDGLRADGGYVAQPSDWLQPRREASCAAGLADTRTGVAQLYFLNDVGEVVQVRVEALEPVSPTRLQAGMAALAAGAARLTD